MKTDLSTRLTAICSLLRRVLEMEDSALLGPWTLDEHSQEFIIAANGIIVVQEHDCHLSTMEFIVAARNITKPMATALLTSIDGLQKLASGSIRPIAASTILQSIADAFPDALFQDSSRCA